MELDTCCEGNGLDVAVRDEAGRFLQKSMDLLEEPVKPKQQKSADESPTSNIPPMMTPAGSKLASKTAPRSALDTVIGRR